MKKKSRNRRLTLAKETLRELTAAQVEGVHGAAGGTTSCGENTCRCAPSVSSPGCICLNTNVSCFC